MRKMLVALGATGKGLARRTSAALTRQTLPGYDKGLPDMGLGQDRGTGFRFVCSRP